MLKIGFDAKRLFQNYTGLGNYSRTLLRNLLHFFPENNYHLFAPSVKKNSVTNYFLNHKSVFIHHSKASFSKAYWRSFGQKKIIQSKKIQVYHGLSHEIPMNFKNKSLKTIVSIHDLIFKHYPKQYSFFDNQIYDYKFRYACKNSDKIIAISESTKQDIIDLYNINSEKIKIIYQDCEPIFKLKYAAEERRLILKKYNLPQEYLLYVGSIIERKNLLNLVKAMTLLKKDLKIPLLVLGNGKAYKKKVLEFIHQNKLEKWILFPEKIPFDVFPIIYQNAKMLLYPSNYEGFGIPILEALHSDIPVLTSNLSSLPEVAGEAAFYVEPSKIDSIAFGIEEILTNQQLGQKLKNERKKQIQKFDSRNLTVQLMDLYKRTH